MTRSVCMFSFRSSVHPLVLSSVRQFECKFLSLTHVCLSVIVLISNSYLLTSNFDVYSRVCIHAYESVRPMRACIWTVRLSVCPSVHLSDHLYACLCGSMCNCPFFCPPFFMHPWMFYFSVCTWMSLSVDIIVCLPVILFDLLSAYPIKETEIQTIHPSVAHPSVRPSIHYPSISINCHKPSQAFWACPMSFEVVGLRASGINGCLKRY